ncbi:hypothetical protein KIN20_021159 [Parelaphostrongylus tenuis]|uniref:Uncharacterized protein n=1 Tax=Parelaphostrongylus tenuis TaxID=148309 RepID=A0AAD5QW05_PARTN|nr:hypothetical protein KIN20_021159 [Parelaphostrongylus tenuis]
MVLSSSVRFETIVKQEETERDENTDTTVNLAMPNKTVKREEIAPKRESGQFKLFFDDRREREDENY